MSRRRVATTSVALACLTTLIVCAAMSNVPGVAVVARAVRPAIVALGLEQNWSLFAPQPRRAGLRLEGVVAWSDGRRTVWRIPAGDPTLGAYRDYRWRKWVEHAVDDRDGPLLWRPAAGYVVRAVSARRPGATPVAVRLFEYVKPLPPPGQHGGSQWVRVEVYRARVASESR